MVIPRPWKGSTVTFSSENINCWGESGARITLSMEIMDYYVGWNMHMHRVEISRKAWVMWEGFQGISNMLG